MSSYDISTVMFAWVHQFILQIILLPVLEIIQENGIEVMPVDLAQIQNLITHFKRLLLSELISLTENDHNGKRNINKIIILKCLISSKKMSLKRNIVNKL